jgi:hypothetical protein
MTVHLSPLIHVVLGFACTFPSSPKRRKISVLLVPSALKKSWIKELGSDYSCMERMRQLPAAHAKQLLLFVQQFKYSYITLSSLGTIEHFP